MKRLLIGLVAAGFLSLTGIEAAHAHDKNAADPCRVCILSSQTVRHAPAAAPVVAPVRSCAVLADENECAPRTRLRSKTSARAPPRA